MTDEGRKRGIAVVGHIPRQVGAERALAAGQEMVAHGEEFFRDFIREGFGPDERRIPVVAGWVRRSDALVTPNLSAIANMVATVEDLGAVLGRPEMRYVTPAAYHELIPSNNRYTNRPHLPEFRERVVTMLAYLKKFTKALSDEGVPLLAGTDASVIGLPGESLHQELALLVEAGLTPAQALAAATRVPGAYLHARGHGGLVGEVVPGGVADVVLLGANPLEDIRNTSSIVGVMSQGHWYDRAELQRRRDELAARYPEMKRFVDRFDALVQQSKASEAVALYRSEALGFEPSTLVRYDLMWAHGMRMLREDAANALPFVELAAELFPDECSLRHNLAEAHLRVGNREAALHALDAARRLCPEDATGLHLRDELN